MENINSKLFEKLYLQVRDFLNWQYHLKQKKLSIPEDILKETYSYSQELSEIRKCNFYRPKHHTGADLPLIIDIHGGGWIHGDKDVYDDFNVEMVNQGNIVSSLTYRTIDYVNLMDQVQDIFEYLHFIKDNHKKLGVSLDHIMLTGDSAGAQLSLLCYCINQSEELQQIFNVKPVDLEFTCLCLTHPVCFIDQAGQLPKQDWLSKWLTIPGLQTMIYGTEFKNEKTYHHSANPKKYISEDIEFPPILLVTSEGDILFKYQTYLLADLFKQMNINYQLFVENDKTAQHVYNVSNPQHELSEKCNRIMLEFFDNSKVIPASKK